MKIENFLKQMFEKNAEERKAGYVIEIDGMKVALSEDWVEALVKRYAKENDLALVKDESEVGINDW